jgi:hypothetical protein
MGRRVLVVDDDALVLEVTASPLIRKPVLRSDLQRVVAETSGPD